jgi:hypothetical protein
VPSAAISSATTRTSSVWPSGMIERVVVGGGSATLSMNALSTLSESIGKLRR